MTKTYMYEVHWYWFGTWKKKIAGILYLIFSSSFCSWQTCKNFKLGPDKVPQHQHKWAYIILHVTIHRCTQKYFHPNILTEKPRVILTKDKDFQLDPKAKFNWIRFRTCCINTYSNWKPQSSHKICTKIYIVLFLSAIRITNIWLLQKTESHARHFRCFF